MLLCHVPKYKTVVEAVFVSVREVSVNICGRWDMNNCTWLLLQSCLRSVLEQIAAYGQVVFRLQEFIDEVMGHSSESLSPGNGSAPKKPPEAPFRTYQAFMWALYKYFINFKEELAEFEKSIINSGREISFNS